MPSGKFYHKQSGRWLSKETTQAFDYGSVDPDSSAFLISFFRWYPDYFLDIIEDENADFTLQFPQRLILRAFARYETAYITGPRGIGKTYLVWLSCLIDGVLFPGEVVRYYAPSQKQAAELAATAFHQIEKNYPALAACWSIKSETKDTFKVISSYGSEISIGATQGGNCSQLVAEEIGQETDPKFDFNDFETMAIPTARNIRSVAKMKDPVHINNKIKIITNASTRVNRAYTGHHNKTMRDMMFEKAGKAIVYDISWEIELISSIKEQSYIERMKSTMTADTFLRQMCATYTGTSENPVVTDEVLSASRKLVAMEREHCGRDDAIYIVSHDVAYESGAKNALCADVVWKLTRFKGVTRREKYRKQCVWADSYPPPPTDYAQAMKLKDLWRRYCKDGAQATYLVVDARAYGKSVIEELMKPSDDGIAPLCCYNHLEYRELEQEGALPVIYPIKAGVRGSRDTDADMIRYAQRELEQGNVELLTAAIADGIEQYKIQHGIKDNYSDARIALPYKKTDELCEQIKNLTLDASGTTLKEKRKSRAIQRDMWSAAKYGLHLAQILEQALVKDTYRRKSTYDDIKAQFEDESEVLIENYVVGGNRLRGIAIADRSRLLGLRKR